MSDVLDRLYAAKARALDAEQKREPYEDLVARGLQRRAERRPFRDAIVRGQGPAIIAEIKRASPSAGLIAQDFDPARIAAEYDAAGADAISVLTEADYFLGDLAYLDVVRAHCTRPLLRKDFLTTPYQVAQAAAYGADAILLIAAGLSAQAMIELSAEAARFDLDVLIEVHEACELDAALAARPALLGINNRNLRTFAVDLGVTESLLPRVSPDITVVSESGVNTPADIARLRAAGARAFLIGEALMRAADKPAFVRALKEGDVLVL